MSYRPICDVWIPNNIGMFNTPITRDFWMLARCKYEGGVKRYGGYLGGFPERARRLLKVNINDPLLHVCGGLAKQYPYYGGFGRLDCTIDLDPAVQPDFQKDVMKKLPLRTIEIDGQKHRFQGHLMDPPYSQEDAEQYEPGPRMYPFPSDLLENSIDALAPGQRTGLIHYVMPETPNRADMIAAVPIVCGFNNKVRLYTVYERRGSKCINTWNSAKGNEHAFDGCHQQLHGWLTGGEGHRTLVLSERNTRTLDHDLTRSPLMEGRDVMTTIGPWDNILIDYPGYGQDTWRKAWPKLNELCKKMMDNLRVGGRLAVMAHVVPSCPKNGKFTHVAGVLQACNTPIKAVSVFERYPAGEAVK